MIAGVALLIFFCLFFAVFFAPERLLGVLVGDGWAGTGEGWSQSVILALAIHPRLLALRTFLGVARERVGSSGAAAGGSSLLSLELVEGLCLLRELLLMEIESLPGSGP